MLYKHKSVFPLSIERKVQWSQLGLLVAAFSCIDAHSRDYIDRIRRRHFGIFDLSASEMQRWISFVQLHSSEVQNCRPIAGSISHLLIWG